MQKASENGNSYAVYRLGKEYLTGQVAKITTKAAGWFTRSAEAGNQYAQYMLGKLCLTGQVWLRIRPRQWYGSAILRPGQPVRAILPGTAELGRHSHGRDVTTLKITGL